MKQILTQITNGEVLTREQTRRFIHGVVDGQYNDVQVSALLTGLIMRGIKVNELLGLRDGLIETGNPVDFSPYRVMDIVGTGGDHKNTFNISTCACLVVAGAGYKVAKHGNYAATSTSGASNVMEQHGIRFTSDAGLLRRNLEECNFAGAQDAPDSHVLQPPRAAGQPLPPGLPAAGRVQPEPDAALQQRV